MALPDLAYMLVGTPAEYNGRPENQILSSTRTPRISPLNLILFDDVTYIDLYFIFVHVCVVYIIHLLWYKISFVYLLNLFIVHEIFALVDGWNKQRASIWSGGLTAALYTCPQARSAACGGVVGVDVQSLQLGPFLSAGGVGAHLPYVICMLLPAEAGEDAITAMFYRRYIAVTARTHARACVRRRALLFSLIHFAPSLLSYSILLYLMKIDFSVVYFLQIFPQWLLLFYYLKLLTGIICACGMIFCTSFCTFILFCTDRRTCCGSWAWWYSNGTYMYIYFFSRKVHPFAFLPSSLWNEV